MELRSTCVFRVTAIIHVLVTFHQTGLASSQPKYLQKCEEYSKSVTAYVPDPTGLSESDVFMDYCVNIEALIYGGENATSREFPFMALIGYGQGPQVSWNCGGSLISENFVLSAAHCAMTKRGPAKWVRVGELDISTTDDEAEPVDVEIAERIVHSGYKEKIKYNDIALFRLAQSVKLGPYIRPICLYGGPHIDYQKSKITGWGATERGSFSAILQKADVKLNREIECKDVYNQQYLGLPFGFNWTSMLCAKGDNSKDTCSGDSGGPLFVSINDKYYCMMAQIGVTSFGKECNLTSPGVYTRVSNYIPWIESIVWPN